MKNKKNQEEGTPKHYSRKGKHKKLSLTANQTLHTSWKKLRHLKGPSVSFGRPVLNHKCDIIADMSNEPIK